VQQRGGILTLAVLDGGEKNDGLFSRMTLNTSASCFVSDCAGDAASPPGWATADILCRVGLGWEKTHPEKEETQRKPSPKSRDRQHKQCPRGGQ